MRYADVDSTSILTDDGRIIPVAPGNRDFDAIAESGVLVGPFAPPPPPVPETISDRQFFQGLALRGMLTEAEALAAVMTGTVPKALDAFIGSLPAELRFGARMVLCGAVEFHLSHPLTKAFARLNGMDEVALDDLWRFCATL